MEHDVILTLFLQPDNEDIAIQLCILILMTDSFPGGNSESEGATSWWPISPANDYEHGIWNQAVEV